MANNNFSTGKVHVDVNVDVNVADVNINNNEFRQAGQDAANAFNNGYQQVGPPTVTPNVNPPSGGGGGGASTPSNARLNSMLRAANAWDLKAIKAQEKGANQTTLNAMRGVRAAYDAYANAPDGSDYDALMNDFRDAVTDAMETFNTFNHNFQSGTKRFSETLSLENNAFKKLKTQQLWNARLSEVQKNNTDNKFGSHITAISGVGTAYQGIESAASVEEMKVALLDFEQAVKAADDAYAQYKQTMADTVALNKSREEMKVLNAQLDSFVAQQGEVKRWPDIMQQQYAVADNARQELEKALGAGDLEGATQAMNKYRTAVNAVSASVNSMSSMHGTLAGKLTDTTKQLLMLNTTRDVLRRAVDALKDMKQEVTAIDSSMVNLKKVTDATDNTYDKFLKSAGSNAKDLGSTITDLVDSTSTFAKMGYSLTESENLGKIATRFAGAADFSSADEAASILISAMRGFNLATSDADNIADKLNNVSNKYAVTATDLAEGLSRSASALSAGGNSIDKAIAMLTTIAEVTRNASEAGSALKVLSLRLRGAKVELESAGEDTEGMAESAAKLREKVAALTNVSGKGGVDIMLDAQNFKDTYQIMSEISKVWEDMSDIDQAALLELIAGKVRSNQVAALLTNMGQAEKVLADSLDSENSVMKEHSKWLDSIEAKQKQLTASWQEFSMTVMDSELIKGAYDTGSGLLGMLTKTINSLGSGKLAFAGLSTGALAAMGGGNAWNATKALFSHADDGVMKAYNDAIIANGNVDGNIRMQLGLTAATEKASALGRELTSLEQVLIKNAKGGQVYTKSLSGLGIAAQKVGSILKTLGTNLAISAVMWTIGKGVEHLMDVVDKQVNSVKYAMNAVEDAESELAAAQSELTAVKDELAGIDEKIRAIESAGKLTFVEKGQLAELKATQDMLEAQKELYEQIEKEKADSVLAEKKNLYTEKYGAGMKDQLFEGGDDVSQTYDDLFHSAALAVYGVSGGYNALDPYNQINQQKATAVSWLPALANLETYEGYNIRNALKAISAFEELKLDMTDPEVSEQWSTAYEQYTKVRSDIAQEFEALDEALKVYEDAGLTTDATYRSALDLFKTMAESLGGGYMDYYDASTYNRILGHGQFGEKVTAIVKRFDSGAINEAELRKQLESVEGLTEYLGDVWVDEDPIGKLADNIVANFKDAEETLNASIRSSAHDKWKKLHDQEESGSIYDDALTALEDLREGLKSGRIGTKEYGAAREFLLGEGQYGKDSEKKLARYLTEDATGVINFQRDLIKAGLMHKDGTMKPWAHLTDTASALGISEELANAIFMKANEYIADESKKYVVNDSVEAPAESDPGVIATDKNTFATSENTKAITSLKDIIAAKRAQIAWNNKANQYEYTSDDPMLGNQRTVSSGFYQVRQDAGVNIEQGSLDKYNATITSENAYLSADEVVIREKLSDPSIDPETEFNALFGNALGSERSAAFASYMGMINSGDAVEQALRKMISDVNEGVYGDLGLVFKTTDISPEAEAELNDILKPEEKIVWVKFVDGRVGDVRNTKFLYGDNSAFGSSNEPHYIHSKGTDNAIAGTHLVDEQGAELIEHTSDGTYELGTDHGPRMAKLEDGDVVHTAEETNKILSRKARRRGRGFAAGTGILKGFFGGGGNSTLVGSLHKDHNYTADVGSAVYIPVDTIDGGAPIDPPNGGNDKGNTADQKMKKALEWVKGLVDWIPTALENLKKKTEEYIRFAEKSIGYLAQNTEVDKAIANVRSEIELNMDAHARYMKQASEFAARAGLSNDIVNLIHEGTIDIREYDEETRKVISEYQKWYDKANDCLDTVISLEDQMEELGKEKLDNIVNYYDNLNGLLDQQIESYQGLIDVKKAYGKELFEKDYFDMIKDSQQTIVNMTEKQQALREEMEYLVGAGLLKVGSDTWYEYTTQIEKLNGSIADAKVSIAEMSDEMNNLTLVNLQSGMKYLEDTKAAIESVGALQDAQGKSRGVVQYRQLISLGTKQIANLEMQNDEIRQQMNGLDVLSEKYQELNSTLNENKMAIMDIKAEQEEWNDSITDLKIEALQRENEKYQQQKDIMEALNGIEDARQRRISVYKEGVGFTYEADPDAMKEARDNLDSSMYDLLISRLEASKEADNIYDSIGNQLVEVTDALTSIDFSKYYDSISSGMENSAILSSALAASDLNTLIAGAGGGNIQVDLSGMTLNNVNSVEELGDAIIEQLPTYIFQFMHQK